MRRPVAVGLARIAAHLVGAARHQGTALPGLLADRIWPEALGSLAGQLDATVLVVGTNGKTTTAGLIAEILRRSGRDPIANRSGANLRQGLVTSLVRKSDLAGRMHRDPVGPRTAVFEVDEATLGQVLPELGLSVIVATNLFRDQLDRFGEPDAIVRRWEAAMATAAAGSVFVYCADDPRLAMLAAASRLRTCSFGLVAMPTDRSPSATNADEAIADPVACLECGQQLTYDWRSIGHLGAYSCPAGHLRRRPPDVAIESVGGEPTALPWGTSSASKFRIHGSSGSVVMTAMLPGLPNAYNVAAAVAAGAMVGTSIESSAGAIERYSGAFARNEWIVIDGRHVVLMLIKNTVSLAEAVRLGATFAPDVVLLGLNDAPADGRDVSWVWDAPISPLVQDRDVVLTGSRASDLGLRIKYDLDMSATPPASVKERHSLENALDLGLSRAPRGGVVVVAATYTALMGLRSIAHRRGFASAAPH